MTSEPASVYIRVALVVHDILDDLQRDAEVGQAQAGRTAKVVKPHRPTDSRPSQVRAQRLPHTSRWADLGGKQHVRVLKDAH
jgi:hypothetical protein